MALSVLYGFKKTLNEVKKSGFDEVKEQGFRSFVRKVSPRDLHYDADGNI